MKKLTKIMLTVIAGSAFILGGAQTAPAAPGQGAPARQVQSDRKAERGHQGRTEAPRKYQNSSRDRQQARPGQSVNRPNNDRPGQAVNRPHNDRPGQAVNRPSNDRPGQSVNRPSNDRPGQAVNRPNNDRPGHAVNRPSNDRPGQSVNRPSNDRPGQAVNRPNNDRPGHAVNRPHYNRPNPQNQGFNRHKAWQMAREYKLTGYKAVPKNYRQKMVKGRPLPSKVKHRPVPGPMRHRLPAYRGYEWHMVGRDLVLVAVGTLVIYEIFQNVFD